MNMIAELLIFLVVFLLSIVGMTSGTTSGTTGGAYMADNFSRQSSGTPSGVTDGMLGGTPGIAASHITDKTIDRFQRKIRDKYRKYKLPKQKPSFKEFCFPNKYKLQSPQKFVAEYMAPGGLGETLLAFHRIGAGKTCAAISIAEKWIQKGFKPIVMMPASLLPGFRAELRSECPTFEYVTKDSRRHLADHPQSELSREILAASNKLIDTRYQLFSYNKFLQTHKFAASGVIIIDEVQNINNTSGKFYQAALKYIESHPDCKVVLLSATPIFDNIAEVSGLLRLLRINVPAEALTEPFDNEKQHVVARLLSGHVSYYEGAPAHVFPKVSLHFDVCKMSKFQTKWYTAEVETEFNRRGDLAEYQVSDNFYIKSRARSNIVFPSGLAGSNGLPKLTKSKLLDLGKYSCKFSRLIRRLKKGDLSFVYTNFTSFGGIKTIRHCLRAFGFVEFNKHGPGPKRFALWTGDVNSRDKDKIRSVYNSRQNDDASQLQIVIGSSAIKEGVSLLRTRQVHVMEPYWNHSRHAQIFGRASRFCSHKSLPARDRTVDIYLYLAVADWSKCTKNNVNSDRPVDPSESVDVYILKIANRKDETIRLLNDVFKRAAVDRELNQV